MLSIRKKKTDYLPDTEIDLPYDSLGREQLSTYFVLLDDENNVLSLLRGSQRDSLSWKTPSPAPPPTTPIPITPSSCPPSLLPEFDFVRHQFGKRRIFARE